MHGARRGACEVAGCSECLMHGRFGLQTQRVLAVYSGLWLWWRCSLPVGHMLGQWRMVSYNAKQALMVRR